MIKAITITDFRHLFEKNGEFAVLDAREEAIFSRGHLFTACNIPLSRFELQIEDAVPRHSTPVVLCDDSDGSALKAAELLMQLGYQDISILEGGISTWALYGGAIFSGVNVPSKAFGEFVEKSCATPAITVHELHSKITEGEKLLIFDGRTEKEHRQNCIPGAIPCPNGELLYRALPMIKKAKVPVVVHCAGRTRSVIGAQTLIDADISVPIYALENGTMAWEGEGLTLEHDSPREIPEATSLKQVPLQRFIENGSISIVLETAVSQWLAVEATNYIIDVRSRPEFDAGHLPRSIHIEGGQLIQEADRHLVTRNARILLVDSDGVRALQTASWLHRMGLPNLFVCQVSPQNGTLQKYIASEPNALIATINAAEAIELIAEGRALIVDVRRSVAFRRQHIVGSWFLTRANLAEGERNLPQMEHVVLVADELDYANLIADELASKGRNVSLLSGGLSVWEAAGGPLQSTMGNFANAPIDTFLDPEDFDAPIPKEREAKRYISWEIDLVYMLKGEPGAPYANRV